MLIRSVTGCSIVNMNTIECIYIDKNGYDLFEVKASIGGSDVRIGRYDSQEKAIKVLDMIEEAYKEPIYINDVGGGEYAKYGQKIFHMPDNSNVEI